MRRLLPIVVLLLAFLCGGEAVAQTCPQQTSPQFNVGGNVFGRLASQWNIYFTGKVDKDNGSLCNATVTNTRIDCNLNTCVNFPAAGAITFGSQSISLGGTLLAPLARGPTVFNIEALRTIGDTDATLSLADRVVSTIAALTSPRTWTLPAANSLNPGQAIVVSDYVSGVSATNTLTIARGGTDTILLGTSPVVLSGAGSSVKLISNGISNWTVAARVAPKTVTTNQWFNSYSALTGFGAAQPGFSNLSGLAGLAQGGLNFDLTATGGTSQFLRQNTAGGQPSFVRPACADLSNAAASCSTDATNATNIGTGTLANGRLPVPGSVTGSPANPSGTTSTTLVMMGMGGTCSVTMGRSGKVTFTINGNIQNSGGQGFGYQLRYGTSTAPTNGVAVTGTGPGNLHLDIPAGGGAVPFSDSAVVSGLVSGTTYWFDEALEQFGGSGTPAISNITCHALES